MSKVICVTVTYGDRKHFLIEVLNNLKKNDVDKVIVVDNGATWPISEELKNDYAEFVEVLRMGKNTGSASGFSAGLKAAYASDADFVIILDDDNVPDTGAISILKNIYIERAPLESKPFALLAYRPDHQPDVTAGVRLDKVNIKDNSFRGFHVCDIPYKLERRFIRRSVEDQRSSSATLPAFVDMDIAPYSGLFLRREDLNVIGYPRIDFVLYTDDSEYTYRIKKLGGKISLVTAAKINDLESSWNVRKEKKTSSFEIILNQGNDLRVYYGTRNGVYFGRYCRSGNIFVSWLNRFIYMNILRMLAWRSGQTQRYRLVARAVKDGLRKNLGENQDFPLNR